MDNDIESEQIYLLIKATGIGPGANESKGEKYSAMTSLRINGSTYELDKYWPYWSDSSAKRRSATFIVPIEKSDVVNGNNKIQLAAGRYMENDGQILFDNSLFQSIKLVGEVKDSNLTSP